MDAAYNEELFLGWYLITLKLREIVESCLPKKSAYGGKIVPDYESRPPRFEWVISIEEKLEQSRQDNMPGSWAKLSIYRIPCYLKNGNDKAYVPQIVSLGPYHHGDKHLHHMERHKWRCLHHILERSGHGIGLYLDSVKKVERRARACYEGRIFMSRDEFVEMMILDGCFVIEMLQGFAKGFEKLGYPPNDPVFSTWGLIPQIQRDMIMLENQIPLFILDRLLGLQLGHPNQKECVAKLVLYFFGPLMPPFYINFGVDYSKTLKFDPLYDHGKVHCLEVFRRSLLYLGPKRPKTKPWSQRRQRLTRCLTKLREAGIKIIRSPCSIILGDIKFEDGILVIPPLEIHEGTRSLFLNLIAFEKCHFDCSNSVTSYVIFMHDLINSPEDVRYLRNHRIIQHCLENDAQVVELFNWLCQEVAVVITDSYLRDVSHDLEMFYFGAMSSDTLDSIVDTDDPTIYTWYMSIRCILALCWSVLRAFLTRKWNAWAAILKNKYFDNPWSIISLIAAFILLVLTFMQTFYTVYAYYRLRS
ncbi:hypothetical protein BT93_I0493 [Corymbia citriodora subsp. variegata]|nr:hypothetical protein BT93_I0493 [Corymbia citriodora subsp. variegata]